MNVVTPEFVAEACSLSPGLLGGGAAVGLVLWLFGWPTHRFWIVFLATILAGIYGLHEGPALGTPALAAGLALAVAAGVLALALVRLFAFGA
ncbi:MAG: hypothetical protein NZO58_08895, partial [Gemmataceae bacterium]|nr:hypothetical protein [Gemmataceae bacterium]